MKGKGFILSLCAGMAFVSAAQPVWPDAQTLFRKELKVEASNDGAVTATTTVFLDDRFSGFRLTDAAGATRPCGLLNKTGSRVSIQFDAAAGETLYLYPAPGLSLPPSPIPPRSGLRHLTRRYDGREIASLAQFDALWKTAEPEGGAFESRIYAAFNPFGPNAGTLHRYDGVIRIATAGAYTFCSASTDASFLLIDDREIAAWPGRHAVNPGLDGSKRGTVTLAAGTHRIAYLHANDGNDSFAIAAWIPPGEKRHTVIPPEAFTPAAYAFVAPLTHRKNGKQADFVWENRYRVALRDHALDELVFEAAAIDNLPDAAYAWTFGDGGRATGRRVEHLYFAEGDVPVSLTVTRGDSSTSVCRQTLRIDPRYGQDENDDARALALLDQAVRQEQTSTIQPEGYALISHGYFYFLKEKEAAAFAERVLAAADRLPPADLDSVMTELALGVQEVDERYELAERCFRAILNKSRDPKARAFAALHLGGLLNLCLNRPQEARDLLDGIRREDLAEGDRRLLDIYLADTALVLADFADAQKRYQSIPPPQATVSDGVLNRDVLFDYNSRYFRLQNLLSQKLYRESLEEIDRIEWDLPTERASPRMNLLKVQALVGNNQPRKAVVCLQRALMADADETYHPALRLELAKLYVELNQLAQAKNQIALIRKESPRAQEEIAARALAETIERKLREALP